MKVSISILLSGFFAIVSALPHPYPRVDLSYTQYASSPSTTFDLAYLNKPMHTTALMAGEALIATREAEADATRTASVGPRPTGTGEVEDQVEL
jgi:hypothetical protein